MFRSWKHADWAQAWEEKARRHRQRGFRRPKYNIPVNIVENEDEYEVHVHALTYAKDQIKVSVLDDTLYISGRREPADEYPNFLLQEYPIKSFERSFELSDHVDRGNITARYEKGVLIVMVPKLKAASGPEQEIEIE